MPATRRDPSQAVDLVAIRDLVVAAGVELPADRNPAHVYLAQLAPGSRPAVRSALNRVAGVLTGWTDDPRPRPVVPFQQIPWAQLRFQHVAAVRAKLAERYAPASVNQSLSALREVLGNAWRLGLMDAEDYRRAVDVKGIKATRLPTGRALEQGEFLALLAACERDPGPAGVRDAALFAVAYVGGLRRSEIVSLDVADWRPDTGEVRVRSGKGDRDRLVFLRNGAAQAVEDWLTTRGSAPGFLFVPITKWGRLACSRMSSQAVLRMCQRRAGEAGVEPFTPHDLRRTCAGDLLDAGEDLATVQRHLGHANVQTTARYDRRGDEALKRASAKLHFAYKRRAQE